MSEVSSDSSSCRIFTLIGEIVTVFDGGYNDKGQPFKVAMLCPRSDGDTVRANVACCIYGRNIKTLLSLGLHRPGCQVSFTGYYFGNVVIPTKMYGPLQVRSFVPIKLNFSS